MTRVAAAEAGDSGRAASNARSSFTSAETVLWVTYLNIALYALCYQLQRPIEPFLVRTLTNNGDGSSSSNPLSFLLGSDTPTAYGRLQSFFSLVQTVGSPLVGVLLDRIGVRNTSVMVFAASAASYAILAHATDLGLLFLSKVPAAMQHAFLVAQAAAATEAGDDDATRAQALGRMTTAYTIGATVGPALGGYLAESGHGSDGNLYTGARLAVLGSLLSVALSWAFLPDAHYHAPASADTAGDRSCASDGTRHRVKGTSSFAEDVRRSASLATRSVLWPLLAVKVMGGVSDSMHSTALPLALTQALRVDPSQLGTVMSASMFSVAAFGAIAIRPLTAAFGTDGLARCGLCVRGIMGCAVASIVSVATIAAAAGTADPSAAVPLQRIVAASVVRSLASHALATSLTTMTTGAVSASERGALLGLEHGLFSVARVVGPTMGTALLAAGENGDFWSVAAACAAVDVALAGSLVVYGGSRRGGGRGPLAGARNEKGC